MRLALHSGSRQFLRKHGFVVAILAAGLGAEVHLKVAIAAIQILVIFAQDQTGHLWVEGADLPVAGAGGA